MVAEILRFRPAESNDRNEIADMTKALYQALGAPAGYITDQKIDATLQQLQRQPDHLKLDVFEINKTIVGYALLFKFWYGEYGGMVLTIDELFVKPGFRSQGISSRYIEELSKGTGDHVALALEVLPENTGAYSLYKRTGFNEKETVTLHKLLE